MDINRPYCIDWPISIGQLAKLLKKRQFTATQDEGFILDRTQRNSIEGRFVQRIQKTRILHDPLGNEFTTEQLEFRETRFLCFEDSIALQVENPAVGWKRLFSNLNIILNETLTVSPVKINLLAWHDILSRTSSLFEQPISLHTTPVEIDNGATAKILVSGTRRVIESCDNFLSEFPYELSNLEYRIKDTKHVRVMISEDGSYQISSRASREVRELIHSTRLDALRQMLN